MAAAWPKLADVRTYLRLQPDPTEDGVIGQALAAAVDYGNRRTNYLYDPTLPPLTVPDLIFDACVKHAARLYRRRDSIDGALGWGDTGLIRVGRVDPDIDAAYAAVGPLVFG